MAPDQKTQELACGLSARLFERTLVAAHSLDESSEFVKTRSELSYFRGKNQVTFELEIRISTLFGQDIEYYLTDVTDNGEAFYTHEHDVSHRKTPKEVAAHIYRKAYYDGQWRLYES